MYDILSSRAMSQLFNAVIFGLSLNRSSSGILQLFASCSQNLRLLKWRRVLPTLAICHVMFYTIFLTVDES